MLTGKFCILFKCYNDLVLNRWHTIIERIMILRFWASELILMLGAINVGIRPAKSNILIQLTRCTAPCETVSGISLVLMQLVISFATTYLGPLPMCWVHSYVTYLIPMCYFHFQSYASPDPCVPQSALLRTLCVLRTPANAMRRAHEMRWCPSKNRYG